jgi:adenine-specific DNA-methyltransferase
VQPQQDNEKEIEFSNFLEEHICNAFPNRKIDDVEMVWKGRNKMDYNGKTRNELIAICKERGVKGYSSKKKEELVQLLSSAPAAGAAVATATKVTRLNYIGSKFQLLSWLTEKILHHTGYETLAGKTAADLFAGTGIVSHHFRNAGARVISNDAELYSSIITHAFTRSVYSASCQNWIRVFQGELNECRHATEVGYVTTHYSPHNNNERKFFTVDNAKRIDYLRKRIEEIRSGLTDDETKFILASLLISADAVSNVPAVYGCFLKNFKDKALKPLTLLPIHTLETNPMEGSWATNLDVLDASLLEKCVADFAYLDPPYNERQYSKNYFPLNVIAKTAEELEVSPALRGKTGIPADCFLSPFCKKAEAAAAFETLIRGLQVQWIFLSYNSESLVSKENMVELMQKYGTVSVEERSYKRFKSYEYNEDKEIQEYLFCLRKAPASVAEA